jgi:hypothetical protein
MNTIAKLLFGTLAALTVAACGSTGGSPEDTASTGSALTKCDTWMVKCIEPGTVWNPQTCQCEKPICDPLVCKPGQHWDRTKCECVNNCVDNVMCIAGDHWDPTTCKCEPNL